MSCCGKLLTSFFQTKPKQIVWHVAAIKTIGDDKVNGLFSLSQGRRKPNNQGDGVRYALHYLAIETCRQAYNRAPQEGEMLVLKISYMAAARGCVLTLNDVGEKGYTLAFSGVQVEIHGKRRAKILSDPKGQASLRVLVQGSSVLYEASINYGEPNAACRFETEFIDTEHLSAFDELLAYAWDINATYFQRLRQEEASRSLTDAPAL